MTLRFLEILILAVMILVLSLIFAPKYLGLVKKAKQIEAQSALTNLYHKESTYFLDNGVYSEDFSMIGFDHSPRYYTISISVHNKGMDFLATAKGNIDGDEDLDIWTIDSFSNLVHVKKD